MDRLDELRAKHPGRPSAAEREAVLLVQDVALAAAEATTNDIGDRFASTMATLGLAYSRVCEEGVRAGIIPLEQALMALRDHHDHTAERVTKAADDHR